ncbi:hypothetical protein [Neobacillus cucumis]|uniref:hypothetical protein n=1 Tax=Neobacillus cucumis TaxID=1740721 RepID=UPI001EF8FAC3|nr:hypothetical protein [Neobacillus cucumis]MBM7652535.1 8-oxo-dGTP pyrophosphatase MutT (NUDIX family) [Neobacillus cucumis]
MICLRKYRDVIHSWLLELPAGMIDTNAEYPIKVAKRELEVEKGHVAEHWLK